MPIASITLVGRTRGVTKEKLAALNATAMAGDREKVRKGCTSRSARLTRKGALCHEFLPSQHENMNVSRSLVHAQSKRHGTMIESERTDDEAGGRLRECKD